MLYRRSHWPGLGCALQEIARKRALGIPIEPDSPDEEEETDPFERMQNVSDDEEPKVGISMG